MHLRPWTRADLPVAATILAECNTTDTLTRYLNPDLDNQYTSYRRSNLNFLRHHWLAAGRHALVLVADPGDAAPSGSGSETRAPAHFETETVVGWVWFSRKGTSPTAQSWQSTPSGVSVSLERALLAIEARVTKLIPNYDPSVDRAHRANIDSMMGKEWDETIFAESWEIGAMFVAPRYQRRGYAKLMLDWVFEHARKEQVPVCVGGSPRGGLMYRKYGFRSIGDVGFHTFFDEVELGGERHQLWVWEPEGSGGKWFERAKEKELQQA